MLFYVISDFDMQRVVDQ